MASVRTAACAVMDAGCFMGIHLLMSVAPCTKNRIREAQPDIANGCVGDYRVAVTHMRRNPGAGLCYRPSRQVDVVIRPDFSIYPLARREKGCRSSFSTGSRCNCLQPGVN